MHNKKLLHKFPYNLLAVSIFILYPLYIAYIKYNLYSLYIYIQGLIKKLRAKISDEQKICEESQSGSSPFTSFLWMPQLSLEQNLGASVGWINAPLPQPQTRWIMKSQCLCCFSVLPKANHSCARLSHRAPRSWRPSHLSMSTLIKDGELHQSFVMWSRAD